MIDLSFIRRWWAAVLKVFASPTFATPALANPVPPAVAEAKALGDATVVKATADIAAADAQIKASLAANPTPVPTTTYAQGMALVAAARLPPKAGG